MPFPVAIYGVAILTNTVFGRVAADFDKEIQCWGLPIRVPVANNALSRFSYDEEQCQCVLRLQSGWRLAVRQGHLTSFSSPEYPARRSIPEPGEHATVSQVEALSVARSFVRRTGLPDSETRANLAPEVKRPNLLTEPYFEFTWYKPEEEAQATATIAVDCRDGQVINADLLCVSGRILAEQMRNHPPFGSAPTPPKDRPPGGGAERVLLASMATDLLRWTNILAFPGELTKPESLSTRITGWEQLGGHGTNPLHWVTTVSSGGWNMSFLDGNLFGWRDPNAFFEAEVPTDLEKIAGKWRISQNAAIELVQALVGRLGIGQGKIGLASGSPFVHKPRLEGRPMVPRHLFEWQEVKHTTVGGREEMYLANSVTAEVDAEHKRVTQLRVYIWLEGAERIMMK